MENEQINSFNKLPPDEADRLLVNQVVDLMHEYFKTYYTWPTTCILPHMLKIVDYNTIAGLRIVYSPKVKKPEVF